jgi:alpha-galactosidase
MSNPPPAFSCRQKTSFTHQGLCLRYLENEKNGIVGFDIVPESKLAEAVPRPDLVRVGNNFEVTAWSLQPLISLHLAEDTSSPLFSQGRTMQDSPSGQDFVWQAQEERTVDGAREIVTRLRSKKHAIEAGHIVRLIDGVPAITCRTRLRNTGSTPLTLQMLSSFTLSGLTPFAADDAPGRLVFHRFRSSWSQEGRYISDTLEHLQLEPAWSRVGVLSERFGQVGSMPVRGWFPTAILEDTGAGVFWGAQIAWLGSWQMELLRRGDSVALAGGLADFEFGHWQKILAPGEEFESPIAFLTCGTEGVDAICDALLAAQRSQAAPVPAMEKDLPIVFNEFCLTWGRPTEQSMLDISARLAGSPVKYVVIDAGWSKKSKPNDGDQASNGDWQIHPERFPNGFSKLNATIRERGQVPGVWFEFEVATEGSAAFCEDGHLLKRHDRAIQTGIRRFWDFRDPWVINYLSGRVIEFLRREGFGYLKVDYNDTVGVGCDDADSLGEGLRRHLAGVHAFFQKIQKELPDLVIENCSSGGHRLEPLMVGSTAMSSFSDAHEGQEIPWIGANLQRLIPPEKSQIWAVLRVGDSVDRLYYTLSAGFLGRLCLSGEVAKLSTAQWTMVEEAMRLYRQVWPIIKDGVSRRFGQEKQNVQHMRGWQAVRRVSSDAKQALVVWHSYAESPDSINVPLPQGAWKISGRFDSGIAARIDKKALLLEKITPFTGGVLHLTRE